MSEKKTGALGFKELRTRAEKDIENRIVKLREHSIHAGKSRADDPGKVLHELHVHQIELEMQNEELRRVQTELEASRSKYADLYDFAPMGYFTFDKKGNVIEANLAGSQMLGVERAVLIKKPFQTFVHKDSQDKFYLHYRDVFNTGSRQSCEITIVGKDNINLVVLLESIPAADEIGEFTRCRTAITDITECKGVEEKLQYNQKQLKMLATKLSLAEEMERRHIAMQIHDDFGQKLAMIKLHLQTLRESVFQKGMLAEIEVTCNLIDEAISDVRALTFELSNPVLELGIEQALRALLIDEIQNKTGLNCVFVSDCDKLALDEGIDIVLFKAVRELMVNIVKYAHAKTVKVIIAKSDAYVVVTVEDDGVGFDVNKLGMPSGTEGRFGLFNIRQRLDFIGGRLDIDSSQGKGVRVVMTVPIKISAPA